MAPEPLAAARLTPCLTLTAGLANAPAAPARSPRRRPPADVEGDDLFAFDVKKGETPKTNAKRRLTLANNTRFTGFTCREKKIVPNLR